MLHLKSIHYRAYKLTFRYYSIKAAKTTKVLLSQEASMKCFSSWCILRRETLNSKNYISMFKKLYTFECNYQLVLKLVSNIANIASIKNEITIGKASLFSLVFSDSTQTVFTYFALLQTKRFCSEQLANCYLKLIKIYL